ncbi:keratin, type I cytoskeletal 19-like [Cetorhinus maximus]
MATKGLRSSSSFAQSRRSSPGMSSMSLSHLSMRPSMSSSRSVLVSSGARGLGSYSGTGRSFLLGSAALGLGLGGGGGGSGGSNILMGGRGLVGNEKDAMQNLNQRLAGYLENVRSLEKSNKELEREILSFGGRSIEGFDWSVYDQTVRPIQQQILDAIMQNSRIALEIDNAKLAAEDFKNKWESELILRQSVESDINGLHQLKDTYLQLQTDLAHDIAGLEDEIAYLKRNHDEELKLLRQQKTQDIQVEVDAGPSVDLAAALQSMRENYTKIADKNQKDLDDWYKQQVQIQVTQTTQSTQALDTSKGELTQLRQQIQNLDGEYNALLGTISALQNALNNTDARYDMELQNLLARSSQLEGELGNLLASIKQQGQEYEYLLNIKMKLEAEIMKYRTLLEGGSQNLISVGSSSSGGK